MEMKDANAFLVVSTTKGAWGKGMTLEGALTILKRELGSRARTEVKVIAFSCTTEQVKVQADVNLTYTWPQDATVLRFSAKL